MSENEDNVHDATLPVLIKIQETLVGMRDDIGGLRTEMRDGFARLNEKIDATNAKLDVTNARLDNLIETSGGAHRGHEERITALERKMRNVERGTSRTRRPTKPRPPRK